MSEAHTSSRTMRPWILTLLIVLVALVTRTSLGHDSFDAANDACMYLISARSLAAGDGYSMFGVPFSARPPGLAAMAAPLIHFFGEDFHVLNWATSLVGIAGIVLLYRFFRDRLGDGLAFLFALGLWFMPAYQGFCNQLMSDVAGMSALLAALIMNRWAEKRSGLWPQLVLGFAIGGASLIRTACILLLPAILGARVYRRYCLERTGWRIPVRELAAMALLVLGAVAVQMPWAVRNSQIEIEVPSELMRMHSYSTGMFHVDSGDPNSAYLSAEQWMERLEVQVSNTMVGLGNRMTSKGASSFEIWLGAVMLGFCIYRFLRKGQAAELFAILMALVLCTYFGFRMRLVLPLYVIVLAALVEVMHQSLSGRWAKGGHVATALSLVAFFAWGAGPAPQQETIQTREATLRSAAQALEAAAAGKVQMSATRGYLLGAFLPADVYSVSPVFRRDGAPGVLRFARKHGIGVCAVQRGSALQARELGGEIVQDVGRWRIVRFAPEVYSEESASPK